METYQAKLEEFVRVLGETIHPEIIRHDLDVREVLTSLVPSAIMSAKNATETYIKKDGQYFPVPFGMFTEHEFLVQIMKRSNYNYVTAAASATSFIDTQYFEMLYGRLVITLKDGSTHDAYYFMGTARRKRS